MIKLISYGLLSALRTDRLLSLLCPIEACIYKLLNDLMQWRLVADLIGWAHQYFNKLINPPKIITISSECSAQGQVFQ